jgi:hypothetical protein
MTISLAAILDTMGKMSKPEDRNNENLWPTLTDTFKRQINLTLSAYLQNMTKENNNDYACYQYSDKLKGQKWSKYSLDGMNSRLRRDYAKTLPLTGAKKEKLVSHWDYISRLSQMMFQQKPTKTEDKNI